MNALISAFKDKQKIMFANEGRLLKKSFFALIAAISRASIPISEPRVPAPISDLFFKINSGFMEELFPLKLLLN